MRFLHVSSERFGVERELSTIGGFELLRFQFEGDETLQPAMKENEIDREVLIADLNDVLGTNKAEVTTELGQKATTVS